MLYKNNILDFALKKSLCTFYILYKNGNTKHLCPNFILTEIEIKAVLHYITRDYIKTCCYLGNKNKSAALKLTQLTDKLFKNTKKGSIKIINVNKWGRTILTNCPLNHRQHHHHHHRHPPPPHCWVRTLCNLN